MTENTKKIETKKKLTQEEMRLKDRQIVRGIFKYHEVPGGMLAFPFKKWKHDPVEKFELHDGQIYNLPRGVAMHLNENCWYPDYTYVQGENDMRGANMFENGMRMQMTKKVRRCSFSSLEFMGDDDINPTDIAEISYAPNYDRNAIR